MNKLRLADNVTDLFFLCRKNFSWKPPYEELVDVHIRKINKNLKIKKKNDFRVENDWNDSF